MAAIARETEAIVLDCFEHGESDVIVTLLSRDTGRLSAIAKGAKRSKKRFVNKLELFSFLHISYQTSPNRGLSFLSEAELYTSFLNIRRNFELYTTASILREFLLIAIREGEADDRLFRLSLWALHNIDRNLQPSAILTLFLTNFYEIIGYRPDFTMCNSCNLQTTINRRYSFDTTTGGLICPDCSHPGQRLIRLSQGTIKMLRSAQLQPLERLHRLKISGNILQESLSLLHDYGRQLFQREIISWKLLQKQQPFKHDKREYR
jgi:DNA repair protein RecO (recombination protein O)